MHASRRAARIVLLAAAAAAAAGCEATPARRPLSLPSGATYRSGPGNFTCVVPALLGPGVRESESAADETAADVTFSDDFGTLLDVRSRPISDADLPAYDGDARRASVDAHFDSEVLPALREGSPGLTVLHRDWVASPVGPALFAVVSLPGGSMRDVPNGTGGTYHPDAVRGVLVFPQLRWVYAVSVDLWPPTSNAPTLSPGDRDARLLSDLRQAVARMTFN
jgi:hypothetical protein